jgi:transcriptional regulator with XRE-family HTH domain
MKDKKGAFSRILKRSKPENKIFVDLGLDISNQVKYLLASHNSIRTQRALAEALGKEESEVSKWLSGLHNLTLESISKMSAVLGHNIIMTDLKARETYERKVEPGPALIHITNVNNVVHIPHHTSYLHVDGRLQYSNFCNLRTVAFSTESVRLGIENNNAFYQHAE